MNQRTALCFAVGTFCGVTLPMVWELLRGRGSEPELGYAVFFGFMTVVAFFLGLTIFTYAGLTRVLRGRPEVNAYAIAGVVGLAFWPVVGALYVFAGERLGLPSWVMLFETVLACIASFEVIRLIHRFTRREPSDSHPRRKNRSEPAEDSLGAAENPLA